MLETASGNLEVRTIRLFIIPSAPKMIIGTPFAQEICFDAPACMTSSYDGPNRNNLNEVYRQFLGGNSNPAKINDKFCRLRHAET